MDALSALETLELIRYVRTSVPVYATVSGLHVLAIGILVGAILLYDCSIVRGRRAEASAIEVGTRAAAAAGLAAAIPTGIILFACRATMYAANPAFIAKLAAISLALINVCIFYRLPEASQSARKASAVVSLILWAATLGLGRWLAFS